MGFTLQGFIPPVAAAPTRRRRLALVTLFLRNGLCSPLGLENLREAPPTSPRMFGREPLAVFRALSRMGIGLRLQHTINVPATDLPLLSFHLLMV